MVRIGPSSINQFSFLSQVVVAAGFWSAVVLGLAALPVLVVTPGRIDVLSLLVVTDMVCLLVGHRYEPDGGAFLTDRPECDREVAG